MLATVPNEETGRPTRPPPPIPSYAASMASAAPPSTSGAPSSAAWTPPSWVSSQGPPGGKSPPQEDVCRGAPQSRHPPGGHGNKVVTPSTRRGDGHPGGRSLRPPSGSPVGCSGSAKAAIATNRYWPKRTSSSPTGCCASQPASATGASGSASSICATSKGFGWNHKRVYRIYRKLELNLRIKPGNGWCVQNRRRWRFLQNPIPAGRWTSCMTSCRWTLGAVVQCDR